MNSQIVFKYILNRRVVLTILILIIITIIMKLLKKSFKKQIKVIEKDRNNNKKKLSYLNFINNIINYIVIIIGIILILHINGIDISSFLAGLGIVSIITGLALQDALKDIIVGINIMTDNYFTVGDVIKIDNIEGKVLSFGLKCTKIKDVYNGNIFVIANRNIDKVINISNQFDIDIPLEYTADLNLIEKVLSEIVVEAKKNKGIKDIKYLGLDKFDSSDIKYKLRIWCNPETKPVVKRNINKIIKLKLDEYNLVIPFMQVDINQK